MNKKWYRQRSVRYLLNILTFAAIAVFYFYDQKEIVNIWKSLSDTLKAGLIAGTVTLLVMWRNNTNALDRHELQLEHDRELKQQQLDNDRTLKQQEREIAMRKDVYMAAVEALAKASDHIGGFAKYKVTDEELSELGKGISAPIDKIHMVATLDTIKAINAAYQTYTVSISELYFLRIQMKNMKAEQTAAETRNHQLISYRDQLGQRAKELIEAAKNGQIDMHEISNVNQKLDDINLAIQRENSEANRMRHMHYQAYTNIVDRSLHLVLAFSSDIAKANVAVRKELGLAFDEPQEYIDIMDERRSETANVVMHYLQKIRTPTGSATPQPQQTLPQGGHQQHQEIGQQ